MRRTELSPTSCPGPYKMTPGGTGRVCAATGKQEVLEKRSGLCRGSEGNWDGTLCALKVVGTSQTCTGTRVSGSHKGSVL